MSLCIGLTQSFTIFPKKYSFVAPNAQLFTMKKLKICSKIPKNIAFSYDYFAQLFLINCNLIFQKK
jgi:hypothetical protein